MDLRVTSAGEASGTLELGPGKTLTYLRVGIKTFLQGNRDGWLADGFSADAAAISDGIQLLEPSTFHDTDLPELLKPANLAERLDPSIDAGQPVSVGPVETVNGHESTPIGSGAMRTYVHAGHADRIVDPAFDIQVTPMNWDDAARFYTDLRPTVTALDLASDTESRVAVDSGWSTPCATTCSAVATLTATPHPFLSVTIPGFTPPVATTFVSYEIALTINGVRTPRPDCAGVLEMPGDGTTTTISCAFTAGPGSQISADTTTRPVLGRTRADALLTTLTEDATRTQSKRDCPVTRIHGSITTSKPDC
ncbi:hypothetical protein GFY24_37135 [Nocardia sp. SYP-A9097]|uniref:hypothetical protein n=1 Tax=Nocardia sp. SYP-A9097 TaxID=2663237 RepID=UPI00129B5282|nr:hypothetical protein [Nocardia sp. SYP-A9097]MRH92981.1 hypothetical protein [Nocardia sp. SYP-A9097]